MSARVGGSQMVLYAVHSPSKCFGVRGTMHSSQFGRGSLVIRWLWAGEVWRVSQTREQVGRQYTLEGWMARFAALYWRAHPPRALQLLWILGRILLPPVTPFFRSQWLFFLSSAKSAWLVSWDGGSEIWSAVEGAYAGPCEMIRLLIESNFNMRWHTEYYAVLGYDKILHPTPQTL